MEIHNVILPLILVLICFFVLFILANAIYKRSLSFRNKLGVLEKFKCIPPHLKLMNLGSNHAFYGLNYESIDMPAFNFALTPQYLLYDFCLLKAFSKHLDQGCVVLIVLPPAIFCNDGAAYADDKYYYILPRAIMPGHSWFKRICFVYFPLIGLLMDRWFPRMNRGTLTRAQVRLSKDECEKAAEERIEGWIEQFGLQDTTGCSFPDEIIAQFKSCRKILSDMLEFCVSNHFTPVIVVPPATKALKSRLGKAFLKSALYDNIGESNSVNAPVLDYLNRSELEDISLYQNSDFLNCVGAEKFTEILIRDLAKTGCHSLVGQDA